MSCRIQYPRLDSMREACYPGCTKIASLQPRSGRSFSIHWLKPQIFKTGIQRSRVFERSRGSVQDARTLFRSVPAFLQEQGSPIHHGSRHAQDDLRHPLLFFLAILREPLILKVQHVRKPEDER